jgi:hypothetical protein
MIFTFDKQKCDDILKHNDNLKIGDIFYVDKAWPDHTRFKIGNCMFNNIDDVFITRQNMFLVIRNNQQYILDVYSLNHNKIWSFGKTNYYFRLINV